MKSTRCSSRRVIRRVRPGNRAVACRRRAGGKARSKRSERCRRLHLGAARRAARGAVRRGTQRSMISDRLFSIVRCPGCHSHADGGRGHSHDVAVYELRNRVPACVGVVPRPAPTRTIRGADQVSRCLASRRRTTRTRVAAAARLQDSERHASPVSQARRPAIGSSTSAAAADARCSGIATGAPSHRCRHRPVLLAKTRGGRCRSPARRPATLPFGDGVFNRAYSLDVLEHLRPQRCAACWREASRVLEPGGTLFVYTHVRKNAPVAAGLRWINNAARRSSVSA